MSYLPEATLADLMGYPVPTLTRERICLLRALTLPEGCAFAIAIQVLEEKEWRYQIQDIGSADIRLAFMRGLQALIAYSAANQAFLNIYQPLGKTLEDYLVGAANEFGEAKALESIREQCLRYKLHYQAKLPSECRPAWKKLSALLRKHRENAEDEFFRQQRRFTRLHVH